MRADEIVLVLVPLPRGAGDVDVLTADERRRAASLQRGRDAFVAMRVAVRRLLGAALDLPPASVALHAPPGQKPRLFSGQGADLRFSVSHTDGLGAVALAVGRDVGVDVERLTTRSAVVAARALRLAPGPDAEVLTAWCAAEAVAKASSRGLPAVLRGDVEDGWRTVPLHVPAGWAGVVAAGGSDWSVVEREVPA